MPHYRRVGDVPGKRHVLHHVEGSVTFEELMGEEGFAGPSSLLYHRRSPSALLAIEPMAVNVPQFQANVPVTPHHLRPLLLGETSGSDGDRPADPVTGRTALLGNDDVRINWVTATADSPLYRNAAGDELAYVYEGSAAIESVFGRLPLEAGDYVVIPAGTTHRWRVPSPVKALIIEASGHLDIPERYRNTAGQLREGAPYSDRDLRAPGEPLLGDTEPGDGNGGDAEVAGGRRGYAVLVRTRSGFSRHVLANHPFDVVGWDGCVYPWALSIFDFEPLVGRIHQPPPVHQTFAGPSFVVCSFVPRPYDFDPESVKVPYHHANVDCDEVLFYAGGDFMSRAGSGIGAGSISLHPSGFVHGPQPTSWERAAGEKGTEELAVMIDTFAPLGLSAEAMVVRDPAYPFSWAQNGGEGAR